MPFRRFVENNFSLVLLLSALVGLLVPGIDRLPDETAVLILALLMFFACYKLRDGGFSAVRWRDIGLFCLLRYGVLPVVLWGVAYLLLPSHATGILLLSTVPAAVSSPALTAIYGGAIPAAFAIAIASQLAIPFLLPLQFGWLSQAGLAAHGQVVPEPWPLFMTMVWCIFLPMLVYGVTRLHRRSADYFYDHGRYLAIVLVALVITLVIAKQREVIWGSLHPAGLAAMALSLAVAFACFGLYLAFGHWFSLWFARRCRPAERITYITCSGFNNVALSISLALLHFSAEVVLFVALAEIGWALLPTVLARLLPPQDAPPD